MLVNVPDVDKSRADEDAVLAAAVAEEEAALGDTGRILLRPSGTEALVRVMVEAPTSELAHDVADRLAGVVNRRCSPLSSAGKRRELRRASRVAASPRVERWPLEIRDHRPA